MNLMKSGNISEEELFNSGIKDLKLRPYQLSGVQWLLKCFNNNHGCILADEMGLGKTCQTIAFLTYAYGRKLARGASLVLSPLSVLGNWTNEFKRFSNLDVIIYTGDKDKRSELRHQIWSKRHSVQIILSTYENCLNDSDFLKKLSWSVLVVDEGHRLKNSNSQLYQALQMFKIKHHILLTGTPIQNNVDELNSLLSFVHPSAFSVSSSKELDLKLIQSHLDMYMLRRTKSEVVKDLPKKSEVILYHGISELQKKYYKAILLKDIDAFNQSKQPNKTSLLNVLMHLRKCVNHPYLFDGVEPEPFELGEHLVNASGKLIVIDKLLAYLYDAGHKVLVFCQMARMLDILQDYLHFRGYTYERLDGSVRGEERYIAVENFNNDSDTFVFLLSTRAGGQGLNLTAADTVIFVDSDFNPQADLQAAARCHRIGQTRHVKIIRLVGRSTVEEIVLKKAQEKLELSATIMGTRDGSGSITDDAYELRDILKFGLDKLLASESNVKTDIDFTTILGRTLNGHWQAEQLDDTVAAHDSQSNEALVENMYVFEGTDYGKESSGADKAAFDQLVSEHLQQVELGTDEGRSSRQKGIVSLVTSLPDPVQRKPRKQLTPEELEARRIKRAENAARRAKEAEEEEMRQAQEKRNRLEKKWQISGYKSCNLSIDESEEESDTSDEQEEDESSSDIQYVVGDVTHPQLSHDGDAIIVHCVDDSGRWGQGGLFDAISRRSQVPQQRYIEAGKNKDLALGDAHLVPLDDIESRSNGNDFVALVVAQHTDRKTQFRSGVNLSALSQALQRIYLSAKRKRGSVHLPRIGYKTQGFNWYGIERLIRKHLASKGIQTFVYYYKRKQVLKRKLVDSDSDQESSVEVLSKQSYPSSVYNDKDDGCNDKSSSSLMQGLSIYLHNFPPSVLQQMKRQIIQADGDIHATVEESTNYIIVSENNANLEELKEYKKEFEDVTILTSEWLHKCFKEGELIDVSKYKYNIN